MDNVLLSIIIPMYNASSFIENTVSYIFSAEVSYDDLEVLLVDDGSKDCTKEKCIELVQKYPQIHYLRKENGGIADARNFGLKNSRGKYVFFHDHDDHLCSENLKKILEYIKTKDSDMFLFDVDVISNNSKTNFYKLNPKCCGKPLNRIEKESLFKTMFFIEKNNSSVVSNRFGHIWSVILKKEFIDKNEISFKIRCDYEDDFTFLLEMLLKNCVIHCVDLCIYNWIIYPTSESHSRKFIKDYLNKIKTYLNYLADRIQDSIFCNYKKEAINNISWRKTRDFLLVFGSKNNPERTYQKFKELCLQHGVRKTIIAKTYFKKSFRQKFLVFIFFFRLYKLCFNRIVEK